MVQKAAQQLLFDVDGRGCGGDAHPGLAVLVIDMPPGTGDVLLTLGQLVQVDGAVIVSTPQDVALIDAKKGVAMFRKVDIPIVGLHLNMAHFTCSTCLTPHNIFGPLTSFHQTAAALSLKILGELSIAPSISADGDSGSPTTLRSGPTENVQGVGEVQSVVGWCGEAGPGSGRRQRHIEGDGVDPPDALYTFIGIRCLIIPND